MFTRGRVSALEQELSVLDEELRSVASAASFAREDMSQADERSVLALAEVRALAGRVDAWQAEVDRVVESRLGRMERQLAQQVGVDVHKEVIR